MSGLVATVPLSQAEFAASMARLGPFEPAPHIAVGLSGGPDSAALLSLASDWAAAGGGRVTALIVDHRLRAASTAEAQAAAAMARAAGADPVVLTREGERPSGNLQAAAREARYRLMADWCAARGVVHLLLAHHLDDQAETFLLRLARGSGVDGLSAMAPAVELDRLRLLRPLLDVPRARLLAFLAARGLTPIEDPSNHDDRFDRVRLRRSMPGLGPLGLDARGLAATAKRLGRARQALEHQTAAVLARAAAVHPEGYARLDGGLLASAPDEIGLRALSRLLAAIGGRSHPPRLDRVERLYDGLRRGALAGGRTLAGCRIKPVTGGLLFLREPGGIDDVLAASGERVWDRRFLIGCGGDRQGLEIRKLGAAGWQQIVADRPGLKRSPVPGPVRPTLPAVWDLEGVLEVPHLCYVRTAAPAGEGVVRYISFAPRRSIQATRFTRQERAVNTM